MARVTGLRAKPITPARLERVALWYLERFASSRENLRRVLMRRVRRAVRELGEDEAKGTALVTALLDRYAASGLLDDERYAAGRTASLHRRGASALAIGRSLAAKGVSEEAIADAARSERPGGDLAAAVSLARRRHLGPFRPSTQAREAKAGADLATMARAGFSRRLALLVLEAANPEALVPLLEASIENSECVDPGLEDRRHEEDDS